MLGHALRCEAAARVADEEIADQAGTVRFLAGAHQASPGLGLPVARFGAAFPVLEQVAPVGLIALQGGGEFTRELQALELRGVAGQVMRERRAERFGGQLRQQRHQAPAQGVAVEQRLPRQAGAVGAQQLPDEFAGQLERHVGDDAALFGQFGLQPAAHADLRDEHGRRGQQARGRGLRDALAEAGREAAQVVAEIEMEHGRPVSAPAGVNRRLSVNRSQMRRRVA